MAEAQITEGNDEVVVVEGEGTTSPETESISEPQYTEVEQKAMRMGWKPKDEFADEDDFVDADEFIKRKPLFDRNAQLKSELKDVKKALRELANFQLQVRENERKKVLTELTERKRKALVEGDAEALIEVDEEIADVRAQEIAQKNTPKIQQGPHPNFVAWVEKNTWYAQDAELRAEADFLGTRYAASNPDKDPEEVLQYVSGRIRKMYPEKFQNPNRSRPSSVEGASGAKSGPANKKSNDFELTDEERKVMRTFVRQEIMSEDEYIAELKKIKGVA